MTMNRRRLMLGLGAALLVGGWGTTRLASRPEVDVGSGLAKASSAHVSVWDTSYLPAYIGGVAAMAVGAGLIGFAVLRPTNRNDE